VSGARARARRPILLLLVFGVFLVIVGITALAQAIIVSTNYSKSIMESVVRDDAATIRSVADVLLTPTDLVPGSTEATRSVTIQKGLGALVDPGGILRVEVRLTDGTALWASDPAVIGGKAGPSADFTRALSAAASADFVPVETSEAIGAPLGADTLLREYFPIQSGGKVLAVVGLWRDAQPILARLDSIRTDVIIVTLTASLIAGIVLFLVFRAAQGRIIRQTEALIEATRRDPLTGTPNHGTLVEALAEAIEAARARREPISVALLDIDNFRLLNDTHGHAAGDEAILTVAVLLRTEFPTGATIGRYGPDEFLVIDPSAEVLTMERAVHRLRASLAERALQFGDSESLPVTISAGICAYPEHAGSVTDLLSGAAITLQEAKTSGGDAVRIAGPGFDVPAEIRTFDVYQGLILAVDGKDRYTKRHSEDVARYAVFLAEQLGLEPDLIATVRVAALLHDVGKIGVPDAVLRKPARLSEDEFSVMKQHVTLGDSIVRDLPNIELIRAGIRHHHERWDGSGYPDALREDDIPLVARIVAVGDAFSAMTTTRPYRKALDLEEALRRLEQAAGSQLEARLVEVFVVGLRTVADAPQPGLDAASGRLWSPYSKVA
jgi:diguanylate cyclase (GGDEF)-like protein/putative nucleotidyltransferase with HDIG domain